MSIFFGNSSNINNNSYAQSVAPNDTVGIRGAVNSNTSIDLPSGGTVSGEVVSKDGNQITLKLSNDQTISARLEGNSNIEVGNRLTFEVAKGGSNQTFLRPLFSNLAANPAVNAALKAAGLPLTGTNIAMTTQMMNEGMSVNRNALYDMAKTVASFPSSNVSSIVSMTNLNIPITTDNINQYDNYQNFRHQIMNDVINIADGLTDMMQEATITDDLGGLKLTSDILALVSDEMEEAYSNNLSSDEMQSLVSSSIDTSEGLVANNIDINKQVQGQSTDINVNSSTQNTVDNTTLINGSSNIDSLSDTIIDGNGNIPNESASYEANPILEAKVNVLNELNDLLDLLGRDVVTSDATDGELILSVKNLLDEAINNGGNIELNENASVNENNQNVDNVLHSLNESNNSTNNSTSSNALKNNLVNQLDVLNQGKENVSTRSTANNILLDPNIIDNKDEELLSKKSSENMIKKLTDIVKSDDFGKVVNNKIKDQLSLAPADVAKKGKIDDLYDRISRQTAKISELLQANDRQDSSVAKSADNINANVKFMNDINEFMNYVQLPLKMAGENAHGDLYVYAKKKSLAESDGNFTALLHLDMEHLGPMDIHIAMQDYTKVNTHFYLESEELLDFIEEHIDELNKRLEEKGYSSSINVSNNPNENKTPITKEFGKDDFVAEKTNNAGIRLCFDVRA